MTKETETNIENINFWEAETPIRELSGGINPASPENTYNMIKQDSTINALARVSSKSGIVKRDFTTTGVITTKNGNTDLQVIIEDYANVKLTQSTSKLLDKLIIDFTEKGNKKLIQIPLKEYMALNGLKDEKEARKRIKADLEALHSITCTAYAGNKKDYINFEIISERGIKNGVIFANFTDSIYSHLLNCKPMPYSKEIFKIPNKSPYGFYLSRKIHELKKMNQRDTVTAEKRESFNVSVKTLLEVCIKNGMPTYEEVQATDRQVNARIIEPFIRDLNIASMPADKMIFEWHWCNAKGEELKEDDAILATETAKGKYKALEYKDWINKYIKITFAEDYPTAEPDKKKMPKKKK